MTIISVEIIKPLVESDIRPFTEIVMESLKMLESFKLLLSAYVIRIKIYRTVTKLINLLYKLVNDRLQNLFT